MNRVPDGADVSCVEVVHRRYVPYSHAHYAGNLVDGAYVLGLFGDVATDLCITTDQDEGLFASYSDVQFKAPVMSGDVVEVVGRLIRWGIRSREIYFECRVVSRSADSGNGSASRPMEPAVTTVTARGTVVVRATPIDGID